MSSAKTGSAAPREREAPRTAPRKSPDALAGAPSGNGASEASPKNTSAQQLPNGPLVVSRRRRWQSGRRVLAVVLLVLVPTAGAALVSAQRPPTYVAVAEVLYAGTQTTSSETIERELATQRVLLVNRTAIESAARAVGRDPKVVTENVTTELLEGSNVLRLRAEDRSARVAIALVTSLTVQYTAVVQERAASRLDERQQAIAAQIAAANARLTTISERVRAISPGVFNLPLAAQAEVRGLESEAQVLRQQVVDLQQESLLWTAGNPEAAISTAEVVAGPTVLDEPVAPQPLRAAAGGALVGLLLAFLLVTFSRRRRPADDPEVLTRP